MCHTVLTRKPVTVNIQIYKPPPAFSWLAQYSQHVHCSPPAQEGALPLPRRLSTADTTVNQLHSPLVFTVHLSESHHNVILSSAWSLKWPFPNRLSHENSLHSHLLPFTTCTDPSLMSLSEYN